ncbi:MAG: hypothetical protein QNJ78_14830 [Gammaproteobacteria bacterium]|nr:hypothetical protein [Gammaproteobacteria bacterium]
MTDPGQTDAKGRRRLLIVMILSIVVFFIVDTFELVSMEKILQGDPGEPPIERIQLLLSILFWPLVPLGLYVVYFGVRILKAGRFPPPGSWTLRSVNINTGKTAVIRGWIAIVTGLILCGLALYGAVIIPAELARLL